MKLFSSGAKRPYIQTGFRNMSNALTIEELLGPVDGPYRDQVCWAPLFSSSR